MARTARQRAASKRNLIAARRKRKRRNVRRAVGAAAVLGVAVAAYKGQVSGVHYAHKRGGVGVSMGGYRRGAYANVRLGRNTVGGKYQLRRKKK